MSTGLTSPIITEPFCADGADGVDYTEPPTSGTSTEVTQDDGFPVIFATPLNAGGQPIRRQDVNGAFRLYSAILAYMQAGQYFTFDADISDKIGGYPKGTLLQYERTNGSTGFVESQIDNNTDDFVDDPSLIGTNWIDPEEEFVCNGRLTGVSNSPIADTSNTGSTTLYFTPYLGNTISLYDTTINTWVKQKFSQVSQLIASLPDVADKALYHVYAYSTGATTIALEFQKWTSGEPATAMQDGVQVKSGDASRLLLGTFAIRYYSPDLTYKIFDWDGQRLIRNHYNKQARNLVAYDANQASDGDLGSVVTVQRTTTVGVGSFETIFDSTSEVLRITWTGMGEIEGSTSLSSAFVSAFIGVNSDIAYATPGTPAKIGRTGYGTAPADPLPDFQAGMCYGLNYRNSGFFYFQKLWTNGDIGAGTVFVQDAGGLTAQMFG